LWTEKRIKKNYNIVREEIGWRKRRRDWGARRTRLRSRLETKVKGGPAMIHS
jgi:hypothetical protein